MYRILVTGDCHGGSKWGLTPPRYHNDINREWLGPFWNFWTSTLEQIGVVDLHIDLGDGIDGPQNKDPGALMVTDIGDQAEMTAEVLSMVKAIKRRLIRGTGYHTDRQMSFEDIVAKELNTDAHDEYSFEIYGRLCHMRHVVGRSDTPYGQYTQDAKEMTNEILQAEREQYKAASLLGRAHVHYATVIGNVGPDRMMRWVWTNPALQLRGPGKTAFTRKLRTWLYDVGVMLIEIDKTGEVVLRPIIFPIRLYAPREYECLTPEA